MGGQSYGDIGNAEAAGIMGPVNALAGGIAGAANAYQFNQLMNRMYPQGSQSSIYEGSSQRYSPSPFPIYEN
jgi:hypothetical protein